jgi:LemA protein
MKTVRKLEADIEATRRFYTTVVRHYNERINIYPNNVVASSMGLKRMPMFEAEDNKRANVKLEF